MNQGPEHARLRALWLSQQGTRATGLVAFVIPCANAHCDTGELRQWLAQSLPAHMLPQRIVLTDDLPRLPSGKVDRGALRVPSESAAPTRVVVPPRTTVEVRMAALFEQLLGVTPASVQDDFFADLGGHSLVATQLSSLIRREWQIEFALRLIFEHPTIAELASLVEKAQQSGNRQTSISRRIPEPRPDLEPKP